MRIPPRDLAIELSTALLLVACVLAFGFTLKTAAAGIACAALVVATATDLERRIVPNKVVLPAAAAVLVLMTAYDPSPEWALGAVGLAGFLFLAALAYPGGMGMGDVKLALMIGALLGRTAPVAMMIALFAALMPSLVMIARQRPRRPEARDPVRSLPGPRCRDRAVRRRVHPQWLPPPLHVTHLRCLLSRP